ncbi:hypothetical protein [Hirschia baltica]|uniref:Uncharacterized protein n=1 Tax=Hirschia baltica (strain ATCC 49814 / DSM 5838 / IFAM 1418) TaxID=582402 RepID=C6XR33_HIRBI|nr:hypothetical protein [Hirschia baltica]ACT60564.1 hypothetical protein Hbal_2893 [Hirschia baltica ATCC 49814]
MGSNLDTYSSTISRHRTKQAYLEWFSELNPQFAFTGTALQSIPITGGDHEVLNVELLRQNVQHFIKNLSRKLYGCRAVKDGNWVKYTGSIEGDQGDALTCSQRLHVHLSIEIDQSICRVPLDEVTEIMQESWQDTKWGREITQTEEIHNQSGWDRYCLKHFDLEDTSRILINIPKN